MSVDYKIAKSMVPIGCLDTWGKGGLFFKNIRDDGHAVTDIYHTRMQTAIPR